MSKRGGKGGCVIADIRASARTMAQQTDGGQAGGAGRRTDWGDARPSEAVLGGIVPLWVRGGLAFEPPLQRSDNSNDNAKSPFYVLGLNTPLRSASSFVINDEMLITDALRTGVGG